MANLDFKGYMLGFLLTGLVIVCIYTYGISIADNYNVDTPLIDSNKIDLTSLEQKVNDSSANAKNWEARFTSDNFFVSLGSIILFSIWGIFQLMWTSINTLWTIYLEGMHNVLGLDPMITGVLSAIIIIGLIFSVWRVIKTGE